MKITVPVEPGEMIYIAKNETVVTGIVIGYQYMDALEGEKPRSSIYYRTDTCAMAFVCVSGDNRLCAPVWGKTAFDNELDAIVAVERQRKKQEKEKEEQEAIHAREFRDFCMQKKPRRQNRRATLSAAQDTTTL